MRKIILSAVLSTLALTGAVTAPAAQASVLHWGHLVGVSKVITDNNPFSPQANPNNIRLMKARVFYRCTGPGVPYASVGWNVYRPRTGTLYTGGGWIAYCDGRNHTTPWVKLAGQYRDSRIGAGEKVTVRVKFSALGGWRPNYASMSSTVVLGEVPYGS